ncbi:TonB-dependent receptor [Flavihumibacter sp. R14]|nr:TonB-dependent receptor [Flavihumibacter soli]
MIHMLHIQRRLICLTIMLMLGSLIATAQTKITGRVLGSDDRLPIVGASVTQKGTTNGTRTDSDGRFSISVKQGDVIVISFLGYSTQEITVSSETNYSVVLSVSTSALNEVVVTGYTSQRKQDITGAVTVVDVEHLKTQPSSDATTQLQGRAAGVTVVQNGVPGSASTVRIRGIGSFNNNSPLYVVDGVQTGNINGLNPNDIESMQVLKDAASGSIYGVEGSNGVIVITTKQGKKSGLNMAYDGYFGSSNPGKGFDLLNAQQEAELIFLARKNSGQSTAGSVFGNGASPVLPDYLYASGVANGVLISEGNPAVNPSNYSLDYGLLGDPGYSPKIIVPTNKQGTNWYDEITRNAPIQNHNITLSSANEVSRFLFSGNYFNQQAITEHQFFKRYSARLNSEFNLFKTVRIGENVQFFNSESNVPGNTNNADDGGIDNNNEGGLIAMTYRPMSIIPVYTIVPGDFAGTLGGSGFGTWGNAKNPVAQLSRTQNDRVNNINLFGNVYAEVDFAKHFTARTSFGGSTNTANNFAYPFIEYEHVENNANTTFNERFIRNNNWIWTNLLSYKNTIGKHDFSMLAGGESKKFGGRQVIGASSSYYSYNYQPFINLGNGGIQNLGGSQIFTPTTTLSYFGKADYAFDGKYLVSATLRRDASSKFAEDLRWGTFPAFSLGWRMSQENFMKSVTFINDFKLRGSWGKMGNAAAANGSNAFTTFGSNRQSFAYDINGTQNNPGVGFGLSFTGNPDGTWEESTTANIGFDATILGGTTDIVFDYYTKNIDDLLYNPAGQAIGGAVGVNAAAFRNIGSMENKGIDFMLTNRTNVGRNLKLNTSVILTTYNNKITKINGDQQFFDYNSPLGESNRIGGNATRNFVGHSTNTFFGYNVIGLFQSAAEVTSSPTQDGAGPGRFKYEDVNGDNKIDASDRKIIGNPNPDFSYGLNLGAQMKNFDVAAFFYGVAGKDAFNFTRWWTDFSGGFPGGRSVRALNDSWLPDGSRPNAKTPIQETSAGFSSSGAVNSYYVENASYFRLRNLQLGYTLPVSVSGKFKATNMRFYLQGTNLFTITKYSGLDPDIISTDDRAASIDVGSYPTVRQFLLGASITF